MRVLDQGVAKCMGCERRKTPTDRRDNMAKDEVEEFKLLEVVRMQNQSPGPFLLRTQLEHRQEGRVRESQR